MNYILFLIIAIICTAGGQLTYKYYASSKNKLFLLLTLIQFVLIPVFNYLALKGLSYDTVYMAASLNIAMVTIGSVYFLKEKVTPKQIQGIALIMIGIVIYNL